MRKTIFALAVFGVLAFSLTSCLEMTKQKKEIEKEEFIALANETVADSFDYAKATIEAKVESSSSDTKYNGGVDEINRSFSYYYFSNKWNLDYTQTSNKPKTDTEEVLSEQCLTFLSTDVRSEINNPPLSDEDTTGLTFYTNPLSYVLNYRYRDYPISIEGYDGVVNGTGETTVFFNSKDGRVVYYHDEYEIVTTFTVNGSKASLNQKSNLTIRFSFSNQKL